MVRVDALRERGVKSVLYEKSENIRYLTGYTGEGNLLITPEKCVIITDFRYIEQAEQQSPDCIIEQTKAGTSRNDIVKKYLSDEGLAELAIEPDALTLREFRSIEKALEGVTLTDVAPVCEELREVKDESEIECTIKAAEISCAAFADLLKVVKAGMTEKQVCTELEYLMRKHGADGLAFDTIVASGVNGSLPHAVPTDKPLQNGELVTFDFGAKYKGYCSDMTRTIAIGEISDELKAIYDSVLEAQLAALAKVAPGAICKDIDKVARDMLDAKYPGAFGHGLGHGVGLLIHEAPTLSYRCDKPLEKGHVVTVEPGVYIPNVGGCRIEDMVIITDDGFINPITAPKQLIVV